MASSICRRFTPSAAAARRHFCGSSSSSSSSRSRCCHETSLGEVTSQRPRASRSVSRSGAVVAGTTPPPLGGVTGELQAGLGLGPGLGARRLGTMSTGAFRGSSPRRDEYVMDLPNLGDSISEGTVVEWRKSVGDDVAEDEVIAVVETDKVSVDVRSTHVGVVIRLFAAIDDVVEVGKPLCTIDGDEASVVRAKIQAKHAEEDANAPPPKMKKPSLEDAMAGAFMAGADFLPPRKQKHKPMIKFLGKRALLQEHKKAAKKEDGPSRHIHSPGAFDFSQIVGGAMFGRPIMSEAEMEAVDSGGAESAPQFRYVDGSRWIS